MSRDAITFGFGVYNEEKNLISGVNRIQKGLNRFFGKGNYEIIVVNNNSTDGTAVLLKKIEKKEVKIFNINEKGLGLAWRKVIKEAKFERIVLSAIDLPFGFSDLNNVLPLWDNYDIIFGSKAHPGSKVNVLFKRRITSFLYRNLLKLFFNLKINDPQGSAFIKKSKILFILKYCDSPNAFFQTQLALYGQLFKLKISEIPVIMSPSNQRKSKYNIIRDGWSMFKSILVEYQKINKMKFRK